MDYHDILYTNEFKLINENAVQMDNDYIMQSYMFEYFLQIELTAVNGLTLKALRDIEGNLINRPEDEKAAIVNSNTGYL